MAEAGEGAVTSTEQVRLREFLERIIHENDRRYDERFEAQEKALRVALAAHNRSIWIVGTVLAALQLIVYIFGK